MDGRRWRDTPLSQRLEHHFRRKAEPQPAPRPAAALSVFDEVKRFNSMLDAGEIEEREQARRRVKAMAQIEAAMAEEAAQAKHAQQQMAVDVISNTGIGQLWRTK